jgi:hypothetical protein
LEFIVNRTIASLALLVLGATLYPFRNAHALVYCVNNATELRAAFSLVGSNGQNDEIRIRNIAMPPSGSMNTVSTYAADITDGKYVTISGGWKDNVCSELSRDPRGTVLNPAAGHRLFEFTAPQNAPAGIPVVVVENLVMTGTAPESLNGCAISSSGQMSFGLLRTIVSKFDCNGSNVAVQTNGQSVAVRDNLFFYNAADDAAVLQIYGVGANAPSLFEFSNNTLSLNTSRLVDKLVRSTTSANAGIDNNIFWANAYPTNPGAASECDWQGVGMNRNNLTQFAHGAVTGNGNISVAPQFVGTIAATGMQASDFRLQPTSPARNTGTMTPFGGLDDFDLSGNDRVQEGAVDIGAFEYDPDRLFSHGFE